MILKQESSTEDNILALHANICTCPTRVRTYTDFTSFVHHVVKDCCHCFCKEQRMTPSLMLQACHRPKLLLRGAEVHLSHLLLCHEQHVARHDLCNGRHIQVNRVASSSFVIYHLPFFAIAKLQRFTKISRGNWKSGWRR